LKEIDSTSLIDTRLLAYVLVVMQSSSNDDDNAHLNLNSNINRTEIGTWGGGRVVLEEKMFSGFFGIYAFFGDINICCPTVKGSVDPVAITAVTRKLFKV
jgi:hypothetical protein